MKLTTFVRTCFATLLFAVLIATMYVLNIYVEIAIKKMVPEGEKRHILVRKGVKVRTFASELKKKGFIYSPTYFTVAYISQHPSKTLQAGLYEINDQDTLLDLVEKIARGYSILESLTIIEGWDWSQTRKAFQYEKRFARHSDKEILRYLNKKYTNSIWGKELSSPEGILMPDTYKFKRGISDLVIIDDAYRKQESFMKSVWEDRDLQTGYKTPYEALIVASLIEKESCYPPEYPKIAAVILNRINKKIPIQIDASILYGLGRHQQRVTYRDLKRESPYNTYKHKGLPPTPISMPSKQAIIAALHPYKFEALFYILSAKKKNQHIFTNNFESHLKEKYNNKKEIAKRLGK